MTPFFYDGKDYCACKAGYQAMDMSDPNNPVSVSEPHLLDSGKPKFQCQLCEKTKHAICRGGVYYVANSFPTGTERLAWQKLA